MSEISDLESRISAAMDRIGRGLEGLKPASAEAPETPEAQVDTAALEALQAGLDQEKAQAIELRARVEALMVEREALETALEAAKADIQIAADAAEAARDAAQAAEAKRAEAEAAAVKAVEEAQAAATAQAEERAAEQAAEQGVDLEDNRDVIEQLAGRLRRMRRTSRMLRASNQMMRDAMQAELPEAALVNQSLEAELADLRAMRAAELAEMNAINAALRPMLVQPDADQTAEGGA